MKIRVFKIFGWEIARLETHDEATVSDVVRAMLAHRLQGIELIGGGGDEDDESGLIPCECCGELFDPAEVEAQAEVDDRFSDITEGLSWEEKMVWDAVAEEKDDEDGP